MQKTKIEVLLDKMHLVLEEANAELDDMESRLLEKYAKSLVELLDQEKGAPTSGEVARKENNEQSISNKTSKKPEQSNDRGDDNTKDEENVVDEPKVKRLSEERSEPTISFAGETEENEPLAEYGKENRPKGNKEKKEHEEIYRNLEEIRKNRKARQTLVEENEEDDDEGTEKANEQEEASLNDQFRQQDADIVDHLKGSPIRNLQQEIDLNDKFWFINELFDGDAATFNQLLKDLDELHSFEDAKSTIEELGKDKFDWSENERAANKFYQVVRRRYL